jgi:hypothetical protein
VHEQEELRRRLWSIEQELRALEREVERKLEKCGRDLAECERKFDGRDGEIRKAIDRIAGERMIETEVAKRLTRRSRLRADWTLKALGVLLVSLQIVGVLLVIAKG